MSQTVAPGAFGRLLRYWRQVRKRSQEDVALEIDSSIRHISFLENGRSLPSRDITLRLAAYFGLSGRETNNLLFSAGYAPVSIAELGMQEASFLDESLVHTLRGLDPFPSVIIDHSGDVRMVSRGWMAIMGPQVPSVHARPRFNLADVFFVPDGLRPHMENWEDAVCALLVALQQEVLMFQDRDTVAALRHYLADESVPADWKVRGANLLTMSGMRIRIRLPGDEVRTYLQVFNTVGSVRFVPDPVLMIYSIFPCDQVVADHWHALVGKATPTHPLLRY